MSNSTKIINWITSFTWIPVSPYTVATVSVNSRNWIWMSVGFGIDNWNWGVVLNQIVAIHTHTLYDIARYVGFDIWTCIDDSTFNFISTWIGQSERITVFDWKSVLDRHDEMVKLIEFHSDKGPPINKYINKIYLVHFQHRKVIFQCFPVDGDCYTVCSVGCWDWYCDCGYWYLLFDHIYMF